MLYQLSYAHHRKTGLMVQPTAGTAVTPATAFYTISAFSWNWWNQALPRDCFSPLRRD